MPEALYQNIPLYWSRKEFKVSQIRQWIMDDGYINYIIWEDMDAGEYSNNGMGYVYPTLIGTRAMIRTWRIPYILRKLTVSMKYRTILTVLMIDPAVVIN